MDVRSELIKLESHQRTDLVDTEGVLLGAEAFSGAAEVGAVASPEEVETEAMAEADLTPEVEDIMVPETTIIAGVKVAMVTGLQEDPTETAMTVTVSLGSNGNDAYVAVGTLLNLLTLF